MSSFARPALLILFAMLLLFIDFFSKAYVNSLLPIVDFKNFYPYGGIGIFQNVWGIDFAISLTTNKGAAWGFFGNFQTLLLIFRILVILGLLVYLFFLNKERSTDVPLILIIIGAIGNVVDFFLYGFVIDFFHFNFWGYDFPVFNIADAAITLGAIWLFANSWIKKNRLSTNV